MSDHTHLKRIDSEPKGTICFPEGKSYGVLYFRDQGAKGWVKYRNADGEVPLLRGKEYRLKIVNPLYGPQDAHNLLRGINLDQLAEIELRFWIYWFLPPANWSDVRDEVWSGSNWVDQFLLEAQRQTAALLRTQARVVVKMAKR